MYELGERYHQTAHDNCGIIGVGDVTDFYSNVLSHIEECINSHWNSFKVGYETYQNLPAFEESSKLFYFLMALNAHWDKGEMERVLV